MKTKNKARMKVISISNHKGGVGKTTSTINLGAALSRQDYRVLLIDLDPQANLSQSLGMDMTKKNIYEALRGKITLPVNRSKSGCDVVISNLDLSGVEVEISNQPGREYILKELIAQVDGKYDVVLIDCPPSLGLLTINAFTASDIILIPMQAETLALYGMGKLMQVVNLIKKRLNENLRVAGIFVTQYDGRKVLNRDIKKSIKDIFPTVYLETAVRNNVALAEAPAQGKNIFDYDEQSNGARDYFQLANELISRGIITR